MSIPKKIQIACTGCGFRFQTTVYESLNTDFEPNVAQSIINGIRFDAVCPKCGTVSHLEYDILYHDMKHGAMVWVVHPDNPNYQNKLNEINSCPTIPNYIYRVVSNISELREKAACLESGKDDRVVELCKAFISYQILDEHPDFKLNNLFYTNQGEKDIVYLYDTSGKVMHTFLEEQLYDFIYDHFREPLNAMDSSRIQIINSSWADSFFSNANISKESHDDTEVDLESEMGQSFPTEETCPVSAGTPEHSATVKPVFCRRCGAKLLPDSRFCSYCGTKVIS